MVHPTIHEIKAVLQYYAELNSQESQKAKQVLEAIRQIESQGFTLNFVSGFGQLFGRDTITT